MNCLIVLMDCLCFSPSIDPDVSRRKNATILRGGCGGDVSEMVGAAAAVISSFPNVFPFSVRRKTSCRIFSGIKWWSRILVSTDVNAVENRAIVCCY